jgi:hypothetical protein
VADGSAQNSPVVVANLHLDSADPQPPTSVSALTARQVASSVEPGASATRTVLATVVSPSTRVAEKVWIVIGCHVPYSSKAGTGTGVGTAVAAVDPVTGRLLYSAIAAS